MSFWQLDHAQAETPALLLGCDGATERRVSYLRLAQMADDIMAALGKPERKRLGVIRCRNAEAPVAAYLGALRAGDCVMLLGDQLSPVLWSAILDAYKPDWVFGPESDQIVSGVQDYLVRAAPDGWQMLERQPASVGSASDIHPDVAVLLSTSGTTGSPKMVRLSYQNLDANARSIVDYLRITSDSRAITTLPFHYSYGMSVINSQLQAGASLVLTESSLLSREFWDTFQQHRVTSMSGVPYTFQMLHRLDPRKLALDSLQTLTQAGGHLAPRWVTYFRDLAEERHWQFFVMYGQTEASPRISYVPPERLAQKLGSIGVAIPGGKLCLSEDDELIYEGPNVMLGYASCREDLAKGDDMHGRLPTGDLARMDDEGFVFLTGRKKRFVKINGNRISLDDIEQHLEQKLSAPVAVTGDDLRIKVFLTDSSGLDQAKQVMTEVYRLHHTAFAVGTIEALPMHSSGKKDYGSLPA